MLKPRAITADPAEPVDSFEGVCAVCGARGTVRKDGHAISESYRCTHCHGLVRYQGQARVLVQRLAKNGSTSFAALCREPEFSALQIWEPGQLGPFRDFLADLPGNIVSSYWPGVASGELRDGIQCQDLMALSFDSESIDVIITSDIFARRGRLSCGTRLSRRPSRLHRLRTRPSGSSRAPRLPDRDLPFRGRHRGDLRRGHVLLGQDRNTGSA
jgi:hypothetical protein